jgi:hypothetical protein
MSAGANTMIIFHFGRPACINAFSIYFLNVVDADQTRGGVGLSTSPKFGHGIALFT